MLTDNSTLVKSIVSIADTSTSTAFKSIASTNSSTFVTILFTVCYIQQRSFFPWLYINKVNRMIVIEKWQNYYSLQWHEVNE